MAGPQINVRLSPADDAEFDHWAAELNVERGTLGKKAIIEALDARRQGRAVFEHPKLPTTVDVQHLTTKVRTLLVDLDHLLRTNAAHDARLIKAAKADAIGVSEARTAIIAQLTAEIQSMLEAVRAELAELPAKQVAASVASPAMVENAAALKRIEQDSRPDDLRALQNAHTVALRTLDASINRLIEQPRTVVRYLVWDRDWSARRVAAGLAVAWLLCVGSYHGLARALPSSWLAVRSANLQMGPSERAVCLYMSYRLSATDCVTRFDGDTMRATLEARNVPAKRRS